MKLNRIFIFLTILAVSGGILGNIFRAWVFFTLTISSLALFVITSRVMPPRKILVSISRESYERRKEIYVDDELEITIHLENDERKPMVLEVKDLLPSLVEVIDGCNHKVIKLEANEKKKLSYTISCPATGKIDIGPIKVRYIDPLNLFSKEMDAGEEMTLRVLPRGEEMQKVDIHPSYTKHWLGDIKSKSIGVGSEFFSLREYHPGDGLRDINWKATARQLEPFTNEYEGEKSGDVILVVDGYKKGIVGTKRHNTLRPSIDAAASLASSILSARNRLGLIVSGEYMNWVYPGTGKNHYHKIMANLTQFEEGGAWDLEGVRDLLEDFFPRKSLIIFISPLTILEFTETIIDLSRKEYDVMVISPDPLKIEKELVDEYDEIAEKFCLTERENIKERLWAAGTVVVDWDPNEPLEPALEEVLRYKEKM
ncbi:MAG: DUF58 domain-containing protein [Candidatus Thermoplasmatota archaeon]|nr:DUF58 domain-containing protein [Candidatus Thermoplasmatota archaeon]MBS3790453.1 DUF58 domain-containing protein [Candidatus Thermoplasmatota archaeon]